jgi:hypothetical protein
MATPKCKSELTKNFSHLSKAEKLLKTSDLKVRFADLPKIELTLYTLRELLKTQLEAGDLKGAQRVYKKFISLSDEYEAQYGKMLQQGLSWWSGLEPRSPVTYWMRGEKLQNFDQKEGEPNSFPSDDYCRVAAAKLLEAFQKGELPSGLDSVGFRIQFKFQETLLKLHQNRKDPKAHKDLSRILDQVEDDIVYRKNHLSLGQLLDLLDRTGREPDLEEPSRRLASLLARRFALERGKILKS